MIHRGVVGLRLRMELESVLPTTCNTTHLGQVKRWSWNVRSALQAQISNFERRTFMKACANFISLLISPLPQLLLLQAAPSSTMMHNVLVTNGHTAGCAFLCLHWFYLRQHCSKCRKQTQSLFIIVCRAPTGAIKPSVLR